MTDHVKPACINIIINYFLLSMYAGWLLDLHGADVDIVR